MYKYYEVSFKYADTYSNWGWRNRKCTVEAKNEDDAITKCINLYGLGADCNYQIVSVKEEE